MSGPRNLGLLGLSSIPPTSAIGTAVAFRAVFREPLLAFGAGGLVCLFATLGIVLVSPDVQRTIRVWIRHHPEHRIAAAKSYEIRRLARAATCGRRWTAKSAAKIRQDAAAYKRSETSLSKIMSITRTNSTGLSAPQQNAPDEKDGTQAGGGDHRENHTDLKSMK